MKYISTQTSFKSGRLSEKLTGRNDVPEYANGLSIGKNGFIAKQGGAYKRFGIKNLTGLPTGWLDAQLKTYVVYEDKTINMVILDTGFMLFNEEGNPITEFTSWGGPRYDPKLFDTALFENKIYVTHYSSLLKPFIIELQIGPVDGKVIMGFAGPIGNNVKNTPMKDFNTSDGLTMRVLNNHTVPNHIIEASFGYFVPSMVGEYIMIKGIMYIKLGYKQVFTAHVLTGMYRIDSIISPTQANVTGLISKSLGAVGGINNIVTRDILTSYDWADVWENVTPFDVPTPYFADWTQSAWNDRDGWPRTVSVDEGRLIYGGTISKPSTFFGSLIGDPTFFLDKRYTKDTGVVYSGDIQESDPYQFTIAADDDSAITFMQATSSFIIGTLRREYIVSGGGQTVSKKNISVRPHTAHGSSPLQTAMYDTNVFYVGTSGKQVFLLRYTEENGSFISKEISVLFDDILEDGVTITQLNWNEKLGILFAVLTDGKLVSITINSETGTLAPMVQEASGVDIISTSYSAYPHSTRQMFIYSKEGLLHLGLLTDELETNLPTEAIDADLHIKNNYGDFQTHFNAGQKVSKVNYIDVASDIIWTNEAGILAGDEVSFVQLPDDGFVGTTNIATLTTYYAIPFKAAGQIGMKLASTYANAILGTAIDLTEGVTKVIYTDEADILMRLEKAVQKLPIKHFADGDVIQVSYIINNGDTPVTIEYTKQSGDLEIDLGFPVIYASYGTGIDFHIATMPIEAGQQWGSSQLGLKRPDKVSVRFYRTYSFLISTDGYNEEEIVFDEKTTGREEVAITANSEYDSIVHIRNTKIEPCYIMNMTIRGLSNDG